MILSSIPTCATLGTRQMFQRRAAARASRSIIAKPSPRSGMGCASMRDSPSASSAWSASKKPAAASRRSPLLRELAYRRVPFAITLQQQSARRRSLFQSDAARIDDPQRGAGSVMDREAARGAQPRRAASRAPTDRFRLRSPRRRSIRRAARPAWDRAPRSSTRAQDRWLRHPG